MAAIEPFFKLIGLNIKKLNKYELTLLETELLARVCEKLKQIFKMQLKEYFNLMRVSIEKENAMLEAKFIRLIIQDILLTNEYTLNGIAYYTDTPLEVVGELFIGINTRPSAMFLRRIIELHRSVKRDVYKAIINKITQDYFFNG